LASVAAPAPVTPAYSVFFDVAAQQLDAQLASADALDTKAATIFSVASTVAAIVPALLPLGKSGIEFRSLAFVFLVAAGVAYGLTLLLFILAYLPGKWRTGPDMERLGQIIARGEDYARYWAADAYTLAIEKTSDAVTKKQQYLNAVLVAFVVEIVLLVSAALATFARLSRRHRPCGGWPDHQRLAAGSSGVRPGVAEACCSDLQTGSPAE